MQGTDRGGARTPGWVSGLTWAAYAALMRLLAPLYLLRLWWRGRSEPGYRQHWAERFGWYGRHPDRCVGGWIWVHAVSLGETRAAAALIQEMYRQDPRLSLLLTHGTATGREAGAALLGAGGRQVWLPFDTPGATRRFLRHFRPRVGVLMETEVWPSLLMAAARERVPVLLANARLSEKSLRRGERLAALLVPAAKRLRLALAQTSDDADRLRLMGVARVEVCGNLKFDVQPDERLLERGRIWRVRSARPLVLAASTREGEEAELLRVWLRRAGPTYARLLIVPRHPQRFDAVASMVRAAGLLLSSRSRWPVDEPGADDVGSDIWLGDSLGEMPAYYAAADVALLGGSFAPLGGQNLIEAAACGCPLVMGPSTYNFEQAASLALQAGAARRSVDMDAAVACALELVQDKAACKQMAEAAVAFASRHRGAAARMAREILTVARRREAG